MRLSSYVPPLCWMAVILGLSSDHFSEANTGIVVGSLMQRLFHWATPAQFAVIHFTLRKLAHFTEYAVLALLWYRALRAGGGLPQRRAAWTALLISVAWGAVDEARQSFAITRTPSPADAVVDAMGATTAMIVKATRWSAIVEWLTTAFLVVAAGGGLAVLVVNLIAGAASGLLWVTVPAAVLTLLARRVRGT